MDVSVLLEELPSRFEKELYVNELAGSETKFRELLNHCLSDIDPVSWRAAWIVDGAAEKNPEIATAHISTIVNRLPDLKSSGTIRSLLRLLCRYEIDEGDQGILIDLCFSYMVSELYPVAVKVHAMQIIYNHTLIYPELKDELITVIEDQVSNNSVGFLSRGRRIIKQLEKL
jgi:hypothetical protein